MRQKVKRKETRQEPSKPGEDKKVEVKSLPDKKKNANNVTEKQNPKRNCIVEKEEFMLGRETIVYDEVHGIWKIRKCV